ncbi:MAG: hypothetical protein V5A82_13415 [Haloferacaceae archaeon]|jgi:hypothetical protein
MELRSCYFCGVAGRTVEPRSVSGVDVTLCPRCEEKLARLRTASDGEVDATDATPVSFDAPADSTPPSTATADSRGSGDDADGRAATEERSGPAPAAADDDAGDADDSESDDAAAADVQGLDAAGRGARSTYRQALRLLRNREFPMARSDTVDLLSSAYDLDREECEQLLDLCVDRGLLAEADGELREP